MAGSAAEADTSRLERLIAFLRQDPGNRALRNDAAETALACHRPETTLELLDAAEASAEPHDGDINLRGIAEMRLGRFADGASTFQTLLSRHPDDPALRFNLAWCKAMLGEFESAAGLIDDEVIAVSDRAASLLIESLHHLGRLDEALERGERLVGSRPRDDLLLGALANAALDAERKDLAQRYADQATGNADALAVRGMLLIEGGRTEDAAALFSDALKISDNHPRAELGLGLALLNLGDNAGGAALLDKAAAGFHDHLGTWVASAWAHYATGDIAASRARFETALGLDDTFAEIHGGLAVLDVLEGNLDAGRQRADVALRLDRKCFSAALAKSLLLTAEGDTAGAERIRQIAFNTRLSEGGPTLAEAMVQIASRRR